MRFWNKEEAATCAVLNHPETNADYRPHPKSRTAPEIAWLIVREEIVLGEGLESGTLTWEELPVPASK